MSSPRNCSASSDPCCSCSGCPLCYMSVAVRPFELEYQTPVGARRERNAWHAFVVTPSLVQRSTDHGSRLSSLHRVVHARTHASKPHRPGVSSSALWWILLGLPCPGVYGREVMTDELRRARMPVMNYQIIIPTMRCSNAVHVARANSNLVLN